MWMLHDLIVEDGEVKGVITSTGAHYGAKTVVFLESVTLQ